MSRARRTAATKTKIKPQPVQKVAPARRIAQTCDSLRSKGCVAIGGPRKMPDLKLLARVRDLRARADEILAKAETMTDADAREMMRAVAVSHAKLAERLEEEAEDA
jgi:hypothetical protein